MIVNTKLLFVIGKMCLDGMCRIYLKGTPPAIMCVHPLCFTLHNFHFIGWSSTAKCLFIDFVLTCGKSRVARSLFAWLYAKGIFGLMFVCDSSEMGSFVSEIWWHFGTRKKNSRASLDVSEKWWGCCTLRGGLRATWCLESCCCMTHQSSWWCCCIGVRQN